VGANRHLRAHVSRTIPSPSRSYRRAENLEGSGHADKGAAVPAYEHVLMCVFSTAVVSSGIVVRSNWPPPSSPRPVSTIGPTSPTLVDNKSCVILYRCLNLHLYCITDPCTFLCVRQSVSTEVVHDAGGLAVHGRTPLPRRRPHRYHLPPPPPSPSTTPVHNMHTLPPRPT
jgi:hypothetical protein